MGIRLIYRILTLIDTVIQIGYHNKNICSNFMLFYVIEKSTVVTDA